MRTILTLCLLLVSAMAAEHPVTIAWDANPPEESVVAYRVTLVAPAPAAPVVVEVAAADAPRATVTVDGEVATVATVTAVNGQGFESDPSEPLVILPRPSPPGVPRVLLKVETSSNLRDWREMASLPVDEDAPR